MARIVFAMVESMASHMASAIELAHLLKGAGHDVLFVGEGGAARERVEREGFRHLRFEPSRRQVWKLLRRSRAAAALADLAADAAKILGDDVDLLVCDRFNFVAALLAHMRGKRYVILQTSLPAADPKSSRFLMGASPEARALLQRYLESHRFDAARSRLTRWVGDLLGLSGRDSLCRAAGMSESLLCPDPYDFLRVPTIVSCPRPFDLPQRHPAHFFFSNTIRPARDESPLDWSAVRAGDRVLYISLGSFLSRRSFPRVYEWLAGVVAEMGHWDGWHVIIAMGRGNGTPAAGAVPRNVTILERVPQLDVLRRASAMVTHAGINSVLECICAGVPMITVPVFGDQFGNSGRVLHHGLGLPFDFRRESSQQLRERVQEVSDNPFYRLSLQRMRDECLEERPEANPVTWVESVLGGALSPPVRDA